MAALEPFAASQSSPNRLGHDLLFCVVREKSGVWPDVPPLYKSVRVSEKCVASSFSKLPDTSKVMRCNEEIV